jgi:hypothetical protein
VDWQISRQNQPTLRISDPMPSSSVLRALEEHLESPSRVIRRAPSQPPIFPRPKRADMPSGDYFQSATDRTAGMKIKAIRTRFLTKLQSSCVAPQPSIRASSLR